MPHEWGHGSLEGYATFRMAYELPRAGRLGQKKRCKRLVYIGLNFLDVRVNDKGLISFAASKIISFPHVFWAAKLMTPLTVTQTLPK